MRAAAWKGSLHLDSRAVRSPPHEPTTTLLPRQLVQVAYAEAVMSPFLVEYGAEALPHCPPLGVRGPSVVVGHRRGLRELVRRDLGQPRLDLRSLPVAHGENLIEARLGGRAEPVLLVHDERWPQAHGRERLGHPEHAPSEPGVVHEDKVTQGFDHRPLAVDALMFAVVGHGPDTLGGRGPVVSQLPPGLSQVGRLIGADQQPYGVAAVELRLDVRHDLDSVDHEIGDQAVDLSVLHDHADQPSSTQIALAELCAGEVLVVEASHADRLGRTAHTTRGPSVDHAPTAPDDLTSDRSGGLSSGSTPCFSNSWLKTMARSRSSNAAR